MSQLWSWAISVLGLSAFWIAGGGKRWGWLVGIGQEVVFVIYSILFRQWGFLASAFIFMFVFGRNYIRAGRPPKVEAGDTQDTAGARSGGAAQPIVGTHPIYRAAGLPMGCASPIDDAAAQHDSGCPPKVDAPASSRAAGARGDGAVQPNPEASAIQDAAGLPAYPGPASKTLTAASDGATPARPEPFNPEHHVGWCASAPSGSARYSRRA